MFTAIYTVIPFLEDFGGGSELANLKSQLVQIQEFYNAILLIAIISFMVIPFLGDFGGGSATQSADPFTMHNII